MADPWRILVLSPTTRDRAAAWFEGFDGWELALPAERSVEGVRRAIGDAEIVIGDWSSALRVGREELAVAPRLAFVQTPGVGVDSLDTVALADAGIPVANTAGRNAHSVAEWCVLAALALSRNLFHADRELRAGAWPQLELIALGNREIRGQSVGVVGFGPVGRSSAALFAALGAQVTYWTRTPRPAAESGAAVWRPLDELLAGAEILVVNIALAAETAGLIDRRRWSSCRPVRSWSTRAEAASWTTTRSSSSSRRAGSGRPRSTSSPPSRCPWTRRSAAPTGSSSRPTPRR